MAIAQPKHEHEAAALKRRAQNGATRARGIGAECGEEAAAVAAAAAAVAAAADGEKFIEPAAAAAATAAKSAIGIIGAAAGGGARTACSGVGGSIGVGVGEVDERCFELMKLPTPHLLMIFVSRVVTAEATTPAASPLIEALDLLEFVIRCCRCSDGGGGNAGGVGDSSTSEAAGDATRSGLRVASFSDGTSARSCSFSAFMLPRR